MLHHTPLSPLSPAPSAVLGRGEREESVSFQGQLWIERERERAAVSPELVSLSLSTRRSPPLPLAVTVKAEAILYRT